MKEKILVPRKGLHPLFKRSAFDRGMRTKLNAVSNRGKGAVSNTTGRHAQTKCCKPWDRDAASNMTRGCVNMQKTSIDSDLARKMKHNGFVHRRSCWRLRGFWFMGGPVGGMAVSCGLCVREEKNHISR
jgi:hypothetical protein